MNVKKQLTTYLPGITLFFICVFIGLLVYRNYGIAWDEPEQRLIGATSYDYAVHGNKELLTFKDKEYGAGFEVPLILLERHLFLTDSREIYLMRHLVTHLFFLVSMFCGYVLFYRLFKDQVIACLGYLMLTFSPPIYAHSFFNTKDIPFLAMMVICFMIAQLAFEKNRWWGYLLLGIVVGYSTSIRVMGIMVAVLVLAFLLIDLVTAIIARKKPHKGLANIFLFAVGFCVMLYVSWPYLWANPIVNFSVAYDKMSHYVFYAGVLINGKYVLSHDLPNSYFITYFLITNPELWLALGAAGICLLLTDMIRKPLSFLKNGIDRNFLLYWACFLVPIFAIIYLHAVIYDGWRHLYFVYPAFVLLVLYLIHRIAKGRYRQAVYGSCIVQFAFLGYFMIKNHPVEQAYFNSLVSHKKEYLRKNYEFDYWGVSYKLALEYLVATHPTGPIRLCFGPGAMPAQNNMMLLKPADRSRIQTGECDSADYFITNLRWHGTEDLPNPVEYSVLVLNSTAVCLYRTR